MDLNEFLEQNPWINKAQFAKLMWPSVKHPRSTLNSKLKGYNMTSGGRYRVSPKDEARAKEVAATIIKSCLEYISRSN